MALLENRELDLEMTVSFRGENINLSDAINRCETGEAIQGIHPLQYHKLLKIFENRRNKKFTNSVDDRYGEWRFILFDVESRCSGTGTEYKNPKYMTDIAPTVPTVIPFP